MALMCDIDRYNHIGFNTAVLDRMIRQYERLFGEPPPVITMGTESVQEIKSELGESLNITGEERYGEIPVIADPTMPIDKVSLGETKPR